MPDGVFPALRSFHFRIGAQGKDGRRSGFLYGRRYIRCFRLCCRCFCLLFGRLGCGFAGCCFRRGCSFRRRFCSLPIRNGLFSDRLIRNGSFFRKGFLHTGIFPCGFLIRGNRLCRCGSLCAFFDSGKVCTRIHAQGIGIFLIHSGSLRLRYTFRFHVIFMEDVFFSYDSFFSFCFSGHSLFSFIFIAAGKAAGGSLQDMMDFLSVITIPQSPLRGGGVGGASGASG